MGHSRAGVPKNILPQPMVGGWGQGIICLKILCITKGKLVAVQPPQAKRVHDF